MEHSTWVAIGDLAGFPLRKGQLRTLEMFGEWLIEEAIPAGGLGPGEGSRVDTRHVADSLLFALGMPSFPDEIWDLGSGVGLPGIPLSILVPSTRFVLVERSGRRADLLDRAIRVLDLRNVFVVREDIARLQGPVEAIVSRAVLGPAATARIANRLLDRGGFAVVGGSWTRPPAYLGWETVEIPPDPLDHPVWLLIMRRQ